MRNVRTRTIIQDRTAIRKSRVAAQDGHVEVCKVIMNNILDQNPGDDKGITPLHEAANYGHLAVCQLIAENIVDKNPRCVDGYTLE